MVAKTSLGSGILLLLCAAAPAPSLPVASVPSHAHHHRHHHHVAATSHPAASEAIPAPQLAQIHSQAAETVALLSQLGDDLHGQIAQIRSDTAQVRSDTAQVLIRQEAQSRQADLLGKRLDTLDGQFEAANREHQAEATRIQQRLAAQDARLNAQDQRVAALAAPASEGPGLLVPAIATLGVLLAAAAIVFGFRQRAAAVAEAQTSADRLFRTYQVEFDTLAHIARDLDARLNGTMARDSHADMRQHSEPAATS